MGKIIKKTSCEWTKEFFVEIFHGESEECTGFAQCNDCKCILKTSQQN